MTYPPFLFTTTRCQVRPFLESDRASLLKLMSDNEVLRFTGFRKYPGAEKVNELIERWTSNCNEQPPVFGAFLEDGQFIAWLMLLLNNDGEMELGYMLPKESWGRGFATELCKSLLDYGVNSQKLTRVVAHCDPANMASRKVLSKSGMKLEGETEDSVTYVFEC